MDLTQDILSQFEDVVQDEIEKIQQQQNEVLGTAAFILAIPGIAKGIITFIEAFKRKHGLSLKKKSDSKSWLTIIKEIADQLDKYITTPFNTILKPFFEDNIKREKISNILKGIFLLALSSGTDLTSNIELKNQIASLLPDITTDAAITKAEDIGTLLKKAVNAISLKEQLKSLIRKQLEEMSVTGGGEAYSTPFAFAKKGQKTNAATKYAEKMGWKKAPGMPKKSKVLDYKELWPGKKSAMNETLKKLIKQELLNEVTYSKFKKEVKHRTKSEQLHKAIREVKRKLQEIDRIVEYTSRMKQELSEDEGGISYWKATQNNIGKISEMVNHLNNKIKNLHQ